MWHTVKRANRKFIEENLDKINRENLLHTYMASDEDGYSICEFMIDGQVVEVSGVKFLPNDKLMVVL